MMKNVFRILSVGFVLAGTTIPTLASQIFDPQNNTNRINGKATKIFGTVTGRPGPDGFNAEAFTIEVFAFAGECLRLDITQAGADLAIGVASPSPLIYYRNDDHDGFNLPLVKIDPTPFDGWYSVNIGSFNADPQVYADFLLHYGTYQSGSDNCFDPTPEGGPARSNKTKAIGHADKIEGGTQK